MFRLILVLFVLSQVFSCQNVPLPEPKPVPVPTPLPVPEPKPVPVPTPSENVPFSFERMINRVPEASDITALSLKIGNNICDLEVKNFVELDTKDCKNIGRLKAETIFVKGLIAGEYNQRFIFENGFVFDSKVFSHNGSLYVSYDESIMKGSSFVQGKLKEIQYSLKQGIYEHVYLEDVTPNVNLVYVSTRVELERAVLAAKGGESIIITNDIFESINIDGRGKVFKVPVQIIGLKINNRRPYIGQVRIKNIDGLNISHLYFSLNFTDVSTNNISQRYIVDMRGVKNVRVSESFFYGFNDGLSDLKKGKTTGLFNDPRGIYCKGCENLIIDNSYFSDLYSAMEFQDLKGALFYKNVGSDIVADMFSGGGLRYGIFEANLFLTKLPIKMGSNYIHSDFIQLYSTSQNVANTNIYMRYNASLLGESPYKNPKSIGWQCFFTRDEQRKYPYKNVRIYENVCVSNQHHGVTLDHGRDNYICNNTILEVADVTYNVSAPIWVKPQTNTSVCQNAAKKIQIEGSSLNVMDNYKIPKESQYWRAVYGVKVLPSRIDILDDDKVEINSKYMGTHFEYLNDLPRYKIKF